MSFLLSVTYDITKVEFPCGVSIASLNGKISQILFKICGKIIPIINKTINILRLKCKTS